MQTATAEPKTNALVNIINESGLEKTKAQILLDNFSNYFQIASDWENKTKALVITSVDQKAEMKMAREGRLFLRQKRVDVERTRKQLKESALREGQTIDAIAKILTNLIAPIEDDLEQKEKFAEIQEANRKAELKSLRESEIEPFKDFVPFGIDFGSMQEDDYSKLLNGAKLQYEAHVETERKQEEERIAKIRAEEEERKRIKLENERLKKEAEEKELERKKLEEKAAAEKKQAEEKLKAERLAHEKAQAEILKKQEAERKEHELKLQKAREEQKKVEDELRAKKEAELKQKKEAEEKAARELKERQDAERKAKAAPDKVKLIALAKLIMDMKLPEMKSDEGKAIMKNVNELLSKVGVYILDNTKRI